MTKFLFSLLILLAGLFVNAIAQVPSYPPSPERDSYYKLLETKYVLLPHNGTYLLPFVYNSIPHESLYREIKSGQTQGSGDIYKDTEAEFQISFLIPIEKSILNSDFDLNIAYTHHAWWQVYNPGWSRPFRETNYMPEIFLRHLDPTVRRIAGFDYVAMDFGLIHQSNGQIQALSRSWNRVFTRVAFENGGYFFFLKGWYRIPEARSQDDNPDIYNYMGLGELEVVKSFGKHTISFKTPLLSHHFSTNVKYSYPWKDRLRWFLSFEGGYGHSLIEYDRPTQRFGIGFALDSFINNPFEKTQSTGR